MRCQNGANSLLGAFHPPVNVVCLGADSVHRLPHWPDARYSTSHYNSFVDSEYLLIVLFIIWFCWLLHCECFAAAAFFGL